MQYIKQNDAFLMEKGRETVQKDAVMLTFPQGGSLHIGGHTYHSKCGTFSIPLGKLGKENHPIFQADAARVPCEGFYLLEGSIIPMGTDLREVVTSLLKEKAVWTDAIRTAEERLALLEQAVFSPPLFR